MPSLPTDNIYKFLAIAGVVGVLFTTYTYKQDDKSLRHEIIETETKAYRVKEAIAQIKKDTDELIRKLKSNKDGLSDSVRSKIAFDVIKTDLEMATLPALKILRDQYYHRLNPKDDDYYYQIFWIGLVDEQIELHKKGNELAKLIEDSEVAFYKLKKLSEMRTRSGGRYIWELAFGFLMLLVGFYLWYTKKQRYEDMIVKKESEKTRG